jgi:UDP-glucose 4-epimerase
MSSDPTRTVAIAGATGYVGSHLVRALVSEQTVHVRALVRSLPTQLPAGVDVRVCGDLAGPNPEVARDLEGVDLLLNLVAPSATASDAEHRRVHTEATRNLVGAARAAGVHWVGYLSSVKAIAGETAADLLTPSVPPRPTSAYGRAKLAAEKLVLESGIDATVVRCPMVFGPACGGNFSRLVRWLAGGGPVPAFGQPAARSVVSVQNLVAALIWLADHHPEVPRVVHVADPDPMSTDELMAMSLNVSVAAGVVLFEARLQRMKTED